MPKHKKPPDDEAIQGVSVEGWPGGIRIQPRVRITRAWHASGTEALAMGIMLSDALGLKDEWTEARRAEIDFPWCKQDLEDRRSFQLGVIAESKTHPERYSVTLQPVLQLAPVSVVLNRGDAITFSCELSKCGALIRESARRLEDYRSKL